MSGRTVNFKITTTPSGSTGASLSASSDTTDANGRASTRLTLGNKVGKYVVTARDPQSNTEAKFTATVPSVATKLEIVSGDDQTATVNQALANPFVVKLTNQDNSPMSGQTVTFAITTTPTGSTGASLSTTTSRTGSNGQASTTLTIGSIAGTYTVTASVTKSDNTQLTAAFTATAKAAPPPIKVATTLQKISGDTQSAQVNTSLNNAFVVKVLDQYSAPLAGVSVAFSVTPSGSLNPSTATTNAQGQASTTLTLGSTVGTYTVTASVNNVINTVSFTATATEDADTPVTPDPGTPVTPDPGTPVTPDPITSDAKWGDVVFSEVMYASNGRNDVQWIELYNTSKTETFQLDGWLLTILSPQNETHYSRSVTIQLKPIELKPQHVILIVSGKARHSDAIMEHQIYDLSEHHKNAFDFTEFPRRIIGITGFRLTLYSKVGIQIDRLGNVYEDTSDFQLSFHYIYNFRDITQSNATGRTRDKHRVSLIRRFDINGRAWDGDSILAWKRAATLKFDAIQPRMYYGSTTDIGTPGYIYENLPLPVELSAFNALTSDGAVILKWTTESEIDNAGFNIRRSETKNGEFKVVNQKLIQGAGTTGERTTYSWTDTTAKPNTVYYYQIEDVSHTGTHRVLTTIRLRGLVSAKGKMVKQWADLKTRIH